MGINDLDDKAKAEYAKLRAKFYAKPAFAALVGAVVGFVAGALLF